jgi:hypothetical protein
MVELATQPELAMGGVLSLFQGYPSDVRIRDRAELDHFLKLLSLTKTNRIKRPKKQTQEHAEGPEARESFEKAMKALFRVSKKPAKGKD